MDLAGGGAGDDADGLAVEAELELLVAGGDSDDLARVDHADVDALGGDHDGAALGNTALDDDGPGGGYRGAGCAAGSAKPVPLAGRERAGHGAQQLAVVTDDRHLGAVHPQRDALPGELAADVDLAARQADEAVPLTMRSTSMAEPVPAGSGDGPAGRAPSAARRASSTGPSREGRVLSRVPSRRTCRMVSSTQMVI